MFLKLSLNGFDLLKSNFHQNFSETSNTNEILYAGIGFNSETETSFIGLIWYVAIIRFEPLSNYIHQGPSSFCFSSTSCSCNPALKIDSVIGCITDLIETELNSDGIACQVSNCNGGKIMSCNSPTFSSELESKNPCKCLKSNNTVYNERYICHTARLKCNQGCSSFQNDSKCGGCLDNNAFINKNQMCECNLGFFGDNPLADTSICKPCIIGCLKCNNTETCQLCDATFNMSLNSQCVCNPHYFISASIKCEHCGPLCDECSSYNACIICSENSLLNHSGFCQCIDGYFMNSVKKSCELCMADCSKCNNNETCSECLDILKVLDQNRTCICKIGYYKNPSTNLCEKCLPECIICNNSSS